MCKIMKAIMKTMKRNIVMIVMAAALALPTMAVEFGAAYPYGTAPQVSFQSTSTMSGSGSAYSSNPTLGDDGTATYGGSSSPSGPRRAKREDNPFGDQTIEGTGNPQEPGTPIGDAALPLMLLACAYLIMRVARKMRSKGVKE